MKKEVIDKKLVIIFIYSAPPDLQLFINYWTAVVFYCTSFLKIQFSY